jgi:secreted trypsin-like serine protease
MRTPALLAALTACLFLPAVASAGEDARASIVRGHAPSGAYHFMAYLETFNAPPAAGGIPVAACGGVLIAPDRVLTAAHCVAEGMTGRVPATPDRLRLVLGRPDTRGLPPTDWMAVTSVAMHPSFRVRARAYARYDVAVLRLAAPAPVTPARLARPSSRKLWRLGRWSRVIGYGLTSPAVPTSYGVLYETELAVRRARRCGNSRQVHAETVICSAGRSRRGTCQGDSGSPLLARGNIVIGLVSYSAGGCDGSYAGLARVGATPLNRWIRAALR